MKGVSNSRNFCSRTLLNLQEDVETFDPRTATSQLRRGSVIRGCKRLSGKFKQIKNILEYTTLQSVMNAKLSKHRFWYCHENGLIKTIQTIPHNL